MKKFKLILILLLMCCTFTITSAKINDTKQITSISDVRDNLINLIENDFVDIEDYLDQKDISTIDENVDIVFVITHKKTIKILNAKCKNQIASDYIIQVLDNQQLDITPNMIGIPYHIKINISWL